MSKKMLILRGNSDPEGKQGYPDEKGEPKKWPDGALHEQAAKDYATCRGYVGEVLDVSGDARVWFDKDKKKHVDRDKNPQTFRALRRLKNHDSKDPKCDSKDDSKDEPYSAVYGFSGGGYDVLHILRQLSKDELKRIILVVVLGAPPVKVRDSDPPRYYPRKSHSESSNFGKPEEGIKWELVYPEDQNPPKSFKTPNNAKKHMFGPEWLLATEKAAGKCIKSP